MLSNSQQFFFFQMEDSLFVRSSFVYYFHQTTERFFLKIQTILTDATMARTSSYFVYFTGEPNLDEKSLQLYRFIKIKGMNTNLLWHCKQPDTNYHQFLFYHCRIGFIASRRLWHTNEFLVISQMVNVFENQTKSTDGYGSQSNIIVLNNTIWGSSNASTINFVDVYILNSTFFLFPDVCWSFFNLPFVVYTKLNCYLIVCLFTCEWRSIDLVLSILIKKLFTCVNLKFVL